MIPAPFDYRRADSLDDAAALLRELGDEAKVLAGGQSLLPFMKLRFAAPTAVVDISSVRDADAISADGGSVRIGALATHRSIAASEVLAEHLPLLAEAARQIGDPQVRARGTIGGSVAHADPAGELPMLCLLLDATIVTTAGSHAAADFFRGRYTTALADDELIREIRFPLAPGDGAYVKFTRTLYDWALVGAAAQRVDGHWRVGLISVADTPVRATAVEQALADGASVAQASAAASEGLSPVASHRASAEYLRNLACVLTRRALERAGA